MEINCENQFCELIPGTILGTNHGNQFQGPILGTNIGNQFWGQIFGINFENQS